MESKGYAAVMELLDGGEQFINLRTVSGTREGVMEAVKIELEGWYMGLPPARFVEIIPVVITASDVIEIPK